MSALVSEKVPSQQSAEDSDAPAPPLVQLLRRGSRSIDAEDLREARQVFLSSLNETQNALVRFLTSLDPAVIQQCASARNRTEKAFALLRTAVSKSTSPDAVLQAITRADACQRALRERALVALGPTAISGLNLICRILDRLPSGESHESALDQALSLEVQAARNALSYAQDASVAEALQKMMGVLQSVLSRPGALAEELLPPIKEAIVDAATQLEQAAGAREISRIELFISNLRKYGDAGPQAYLIPRLRRDLAELRQAVDDAIARDGRAEVAQETEPLLELLERSDNLLESLHAGNDVAEPLSAALSELVDMQQQMSARAEVEGTTLCVQCGQGNAPERRVCARCGAILLVAVGEGKTVAYFDEFNADPGMS